MKLDKNFARKVHISTKGMEPFDILNHQQAVLSTGLYDEIKSTKFYRENGQLHHNHNEPTGYAFYIQRENGEIFLGACNGIIYFECIKEYLEPDIEAEVILCQVPASEVRSFERGYLNSVYGALLFLGNHHPSHQARVDSLGMCLELNPPQLTEEEKVELRVWLIEMAAELGISYAEKNSSLAH